MKTKLSLLAILFLACAVHAADPAKAARRQNAIANRAGAPPGGPMAFEQVLTDEQRQKMREYMQAQGSDFRENMQKLAQLRRELNEAVFTGKADEKMIKEKADEIAKLDAEQLRARMMAFSKVAATLTAEQKEKIKEMGQQLRAARPGLGAGRRDGSGPGTREPAAPPPPDK